MKPVNGLTCIGDQKKKVVVVVVPVMRVTRMTCRWHSLT